MGEQDRRLVILYGSQTGNAQVIDQLQTREAEMQLL